MLPEFLYDSYKQYKTDTDELLAWLSASAHQCGHSGTSSRAQKVALGGLLSQARCIVSATSPPMKIPSTKIGLIQRVIAARRRCTEWFENHPDTETAAKTKNQTHSYFTGILEKVLNILQPCYFQQEASSSTRLASGSTGAIHRSSKEKTSTGSKLSSEETKNMFEQLTVEEPSFDIPLELPEAEKVILEERPAENAIQIQDRRSSDPETESFYEEVKFAFFCLLEDLQQIRQFLRETWSQYQSFKITLMNASVTTNAAIQFVRRLELGVFADFPQLSGWEEVMQLIFPTAFNSQGNTADSVQWEVLEYIYFFPYSQLIDTSLYLFNDRKMPSPVWDYFYDPRSDRATYSHLKKVREDMILMSEMVPELFFLVLCNNMPVEDELVWGIRRMLGKREVDLSVCFALQVFIDIHHGLGEEVTRGFKELQKTNENHLAILKNYAQRIIKYDELKKMVLPGLSFTSVFAEEWIKKDGIRAFKRDFYGSRYLTHCGPIKPFLLLSHHPLLCGLLTFVFTLKTQQISLLCETKNGAIMAAAHLYNAVRQDGLLEILWPDMDLLIQHQTAEKIFLGPPPTTPDMMYKRYCLIEGISVQVFAQNRRKHKMSLEEQVRSKKGGRGLAGPSPVLEIFRKHFCSGDKPVDITIDHIEAFLSSRFQDQQKTKTGRGRLREQWGLSHQLRPLELLAVLQDCLVDEEPALVFDYYTLNLRCWDVLHESEISTRGRFAEWLGPSKAPVAFLLHSLPEYIFKCRTGEHGRRGVAHGKTVLKKAAQMIRDCIEQQQRILSETESALVEETLLNGCIPEKGPTTLWGILKPNHPTRNGECIHIGVCRRQLEELVRYHVGSDS